MQRESLPGFSELICRGDWGSTCSSFRARPAKRFLRPSSQQPGDSEGQRFEGSKKISGLRFFFGLRSVVLPFTVALQEAGRLPEQKPDTAQGQHCKARSLGDFNHLLIG